MKKEITIIFVSAATIFSLLVFAFIVLRAVFESGANHSVSAFEIIFYALSLVAVMVPLSLLLVSRRFGLTILLVYLFIVVASIAGDYFNCLLSYDEWIRRGMPTPLESTDIRRYQVDNYWLDGMTRVVKNRFR